MKGKKASSRYYETMRYVEEEKSRNKINTLQTKLTAAEEEVEKYKKSLVLIVGLIRDNTTGLSHERCLEILSLASSGKGE